MCVMFGVSVLSVAQTTYTLDQCRQMAVLHNIAMRTAKNNISAAVEQKKEAYTKYFPSVSVTGLAFKSNKDLLSADINTADVLPSSLASKLSPEVLAMIPSSISMSMFDKAMTAGVTAVQPVFMGGQIVNGNKLAKVGIEAGHILLEQSENNVMLTTEKYYWQIVTLREKSKTLDAVHSMLDRLNKDVDVSVRAGVAMRNDLLQVQLKQNEIESTQITVRNGLNLCKLMLAQYIGLNNADFDLPDDINVESLPEFPLSLKQNHVSALHNTTEYRLLEKNVEVTELQRKLEVGKLLPNVGIGVGYSYDNIMDKNHSLIIAFAKVSVPISDWWGGSHAIKRKKIAVDNAVQQMDDNSQLLVIRMQKTWDDVEDAYKQLGLAHKSIEQATENLRLNNDYYHAGTTKMSDLLDAQTLYQKAMDGFVDALSNYETKITEYKQATGN